MSEICLFAAAPCRFAQHLATADAPPPPARVAVRAVRSYQSQKCIRPEPEPMKARVTVTLKPGVLDPQGEAIRHALGSLGFAGVEGVRQGKVIELDLAESDPARAEAEAARMAETLLANLVIENYRVEIV